MRGKGLAAAAMAIAMLAGCGGGTGNGPAEPGGTPAASFSQFPDVPTPDGATMDTEMSFLLGGGDAWLGRLVVRKRFTDPEALYDFYNAQMPGFGWRQVTSVRSSISVQTWQRGQRVATIQFQDAYCLGYCLGAQATLTVSPAGPSGPGTDPGQPPPPATVPPPPSVNAQPLK